MRGSTTFGIPAHWTALIAGGLTAAIVVVTATRFGSGSDVSATPVVELDAPAGTVAEVVQDTASTTEAIDAPAEDSTEPAAELEAVSGERERCRVDPTLVGTSADAAVGEILRLADDVRAGLCRELTPEERLCRGVWFAAATDPLLAVTMGISPLHIERLVETHDWAMSEIESMALTVDAPAVARSAAAYRQIDLSVALSGDTELVVAAIERRATPDIVDGLSEAERLCEEWDRAS